MVLAPEHSLVKKITTQEYKEQVGHYISDSKAKSELERTDLEKEKTGVFTGAYCLNPVNNEKIPIWVGDYVIATYGGGAVMVVPAVSVSGGKNLLNSVDRMAAMAAKAAILFLKPQIH